MTNPITWQQYYGRIVAKITGVGRHQDQLHSYADAVADAKADGTVLGGQPSPDKIVRQWEMSRAAAYAGRNRVKFLKALADHGVQEAFGFGPDFDDEPILVCQAVDLRNYYHRDFKQDHTVMRSQLSADDLLLMEHAETRKRRNMDDLNDKTAPLLRALAAQSRGHATVRAAYRAGALAVSHPAPRLRP